MAHCQKKRLWLLLGILILIVGALLVLAILLTTGPATDDTRTFWQRWGALITLGIIALAVLIFGLWLIFRRTDNATSYYHYYANGDRPLAVMSTTSIEETPRTMPACTSGACGIGAVYSSRGASSTMRAQPRQLLQPRPGYFAAIPSEGARERGKATVFASADDSGATAIVTSPPIVPVAVSAPIVRTVMIPDDGTKTTEIITTSPVVIPDDGTQATKILASPMPVVVVPEPLSPAARFEQRFPRTEKRVRRVSDSEMPRRATVVEIPARRATVSGIPVRRSARVVAPARRTTRRSA